MQLYLYDKDGVMVFQLRPEDTRPYQYPDVQDLNFLGYDRPNDRWKVDASGIKIYASGISVELDKDSDSVAVWSASGTPDLPVYITNPIPLTVDLDKDDDSISIWSSSGTPTIPIYTEDPIEVSIVDDSEPLDITYDTVLAVPRLTETTVVDYTVPVGQEFLFTTGRATGDTDAKFYLQVDGSNKLAEYTSWEERTARFDISQGSIRVSGGSTIRIRVYHEENTNKHGNVDFWGSIAGILK